MSYEVKKFSPNGSITRGRCADRLAAFIGSMHLTWRQLSSETSRGTSPIEPLETRRLLSAAATVQTDLTYYRNLVSAAASSSTVQGYTPAQIAHAYGFDQISFGSGTVKGDGTGQTIAIIDAFNDPNIVSDLGVFDQQFSLSSTQFQNCQSIRGKRSASE